MTLSYPIEKFESEDGNKIHLTWNSDCTWFVSINGSYDDMIMLRSEDFGPVLKGEEVQFSSGMFGWITTLKTSIVKDRLKIEQFTQMFSDVPPRSDSVFDISIADFEKCKEIAFKDKQTKPVHYCSIDGSIVFDRDSFKEKK